MRRIGRSGSAPRAATEPRSSRACAAAFALLVVSQLAPVWAVRAFPSQDGPAHLSTADSLLRLDDPGTPAFREYFRARWQPWDNNLPAVSLMGLLSLGAPPALAEKLLVSGYVVLLPLAALYAVRGVPGAPLAAAFLALPFVHARVLSLGFYAFVYGMAGFLLCVGRALRVRSRPTAAGVASVAALLVATALAHVFAAAAAVTALACLVAHDAIRGRRARAALFALVAAGGGVAAVAFASVPRMLRWNPAYVVLPTLPERLRRLLEPSALVSYGDLEKLLAAATLLLYLVLCALALGRGRASRTGGLGLAAGAFTAGLVALPSRLGEAGHLPERFAPYAAFTAMLWLAARPLPADVWRAAAGLAAGLALLVTAERTWLHRGLDAQLREYASAGRVLRANTTVLALHFDAFHAWDAGFGDDFRRVDPFLHAAGRVAAERGAVNLRNYQATKSYFPLGYRRERNPLVWAGRDGRLAGILQHPFEASPLGYEERTGGRVDTVLVWGPPGAESRSEAGRALLAELARGYDRVFTSEPRGWMRAWHRRRPRAGHRSRPRPGPGS